MFDKNTWKENMFITMFITMVVVNLYVFFDASYVSYEKSYIAMRVKTKIFRREIHENKNLFINIVCNN